MKKYLQKKLFILTYSFLLTAAASPFAATITERIESGFVEETSDTLIIKKEGELLYSYSREEAFRPIAAWSVTKSLISLGIGLLYDEGKIALEQPLSDFFPHYSEGAGSEIKILHLLNHTSGIDPRIEFDDTLSFLRGDSLKLALEQEVVDRPGSTFKYNNHACNILAAIIEQLSGKRADLYIAEKILTPLAIDDYSWDLDGAGRAIGMCGLHIRADDLLKIGELMLQKGSWKGKRIVSEEWVEMATTPTVTLQDSYFSMFDGCGLLFWLNSKGPRLFAAAGYIGQYCVVLPEKKIVAVRQHDYLRYSSITSIPEKAFFRDFTEKVQRLAE